MRSRVAIVVTVAVLLIGAAVASYLLERIEPQVTTDVAPPPTWNVSPTAAPAVAPPRATVAVVDVADASTPEPQRARIVDEEELPPRITHLAAASSTALRTACRSAVDSCAERFPPWFSAAVTIDLDLEKHGAGSRIARAHADSKNNGPVQYFVCVSDTLSNSDVPDLPIDAAQMMVRCMPYAPARAVFPSAQRVRELVAKCLPMLPESPEVSVEFGVVNEGGVLKTGPLTLAGVDDVDAYARRCLELGLDARVSLSPDEVPSVLPRVRLSSTRDGRQYRGEVTYPPTKRD